MDYIIIHSSPELLELRLGDLVGRKGIVVEKLRRKSDGSLRGAWVSLLGDPYLGEQEWYIPITSINIW